MNAGTGGDEGNLGAAYRSPERPSSKGLRLTQVVLAMAFAAFVAYRAVSTLRAIPDGFPVRATDILLVVALLAFPWVGFVSGYRRAKSDLLAAGVSKDALPAIWSFGYSTLVGGYLATFFIIIMIAETIRLHR